MNCQLKVNNSFKPCLVKKCNLLISTYDLFKEKVFYELVLQLIEGDKQESVCWTGTFTDLVTDLSTIVLVHLFATNLFELKMIRKNVLKFYLQKHKISNFFHNDKKVAFGNVVDSQKKFFKQPYFWVIELVCFYINFTYILCQAWWRFWMSCRHLFVKKIKII